MTSEMREEVVCRSCGEALPPGASICSSCGWDLTTSVPEHRRVPIGRLLLAVGWRALVLAGIVAVLVVLFQRYRTTGPGPDLATTISWIIHGDQGRSAELITIHRAYEIACAASRYAVIEQEAPPIMEGWEDVLEPLSTMRVRGWIPVPFIGGLDPDMAGAAVREIFQVRVTDGWQRRYQLTSVILPRQGKVWEEDVQVQHDLDLGLQSSFFRLGKPDPSVSDWMRLQIDSAGPDGVFASGDDLRLVSYIQIGQTFFFEESAESRRRRMERAYMVGPHLFRLEGNSYDLIDARILAEHRFDMVW
jgi:hypothetical protein